MSVTPLTPLSLQYGRRDGTVVVRLKGELDSATSTSFSRELLQCIDEQGHMYVSLDLGEMSFIDSTGLGALVSVLRHLEGKGGTLTLANPRASTKRILDIVGFSSLFEVVTDEKKATPQAS